MLGHLTSPRIPLQEIIPIFVSDIVNEMQAVRGDFANHIPPRFCEPIEAIKVS
jgi:hypothetical protein